MIAITYRLGYTAISTLILRLTCIAMIKRLFDVAISSLLLLILFPVLISLYLAVRFALGTPVLFRQTRVGFYGRLFTILKFRTMTNARSRSGALLPDRDRLTRFGKWMRKTSLDELPELINILKGDMSLVGPRPLLPEYLPRYSERQARRHETRPGITGWAQINGRNSLSWPDRLEMDVWYVENQTLRLDLIILARTVVTVFYQRGIAQEGEATMTPFQGNEAPDVERGKSDRHAR